jgi:hypothetical protein
MIGLFDDSGARLAIAANGLTLNSMTAATPTTRLSGYEVNSVTTVGVFDTSVDSDPNDDGSAVTPAKRTMYLVRIDGVIRAATQAALYDMKRDLAEAFDPSLASRTSPTTHGLLPLTFSVPTLDTDNFSNGLAPCKYVGRSRGSVVPIDSEYQGTSAYFSIEWLVPGARRLRQAASTITGSDTATNSGDSPTWPTLAITMAGAGSATYTIQRVGASGTKSLVLDLSGRSTGQVVSVDVENSSVSVDGVVTDALYVSGDFFDLDPGSNTITVSNTTNATTVMTFYWAWVV